MSGHGFEDVILGEFGRIVEVTVVREGGYVATYLRTETGHFILWSETF